MMKAMVCTAIGPPEVLQMQDIDEPIPKDNEVLIKIKTSTVTAGDCELRRQDLPLFWSMLLAFFRWIQGQKRIILGQEMSGDIVAVGKDVNQFKIGDAIFGSAGMGLSSYAEYKCHPSTRGIILKPDNMTYEEAATMATGGLNGLYFINKANIQVGEKVLIVGAGGSIGTYALQIAKSQGAEITAIDIGHKLEMLKAIGADHVIDYTKEDFSEKPEKYDVIFDAVGKSVFSKCIQSLKPNGRYVSADVKLDWILKAKWISWTSDKKVMAGLASERAEDFQALIELFEAGKIKPVIDRTYPLEDLVEAHRYVDQGLKAGNVVIKIGE